MRIDGGPEDATSTPREQIEEVDNIRDSEAGCHGSPSEKGAGQVTDDLKPVTTKRPKTEPIEEVCPPKEIKRIKRKTTLRREGRDDLLFGEPMNWQYQASHHNNRQEITSDDNTKETSRQLNKLMDSSTHRSLELQHDAPKLELYSVPSESHKQLISGPSEASDHDCPALNKLGSGAGIHWLEPKTEPINGGDAREGNNGNLDVIPRPDQVKLDTTTQFKQVFFGSIIDKVSSEVGAHSSDAEREGHLETRDFANGWQCLPDMVFNSTNVNKNDTIAPWLKRSRLPVSDDKQMPNEEERNHDPAPPNEADLNATHVYINGF